AGLLSFYRTEQSDLMFVCFLLTSKLRQCDLVRVQVYKRAVPSKMDHFCVPHQSNTIATKTNHEIHTSFGFVNLWPHGLGHRVSPHRAQRCGESQLTGSGSDSSLDLWHVQQHIRHCAPQWSHHRWS